MNIYFLGAIAIVSYTLHSFFSFKQMKHFNEVFLKAKREGDVLVGKLKGKILNKGVIVLILLNKDNSIKTMLVLEGRSVFKKFEEYNQFNGFNLKDLEYKTAYKKLDKNIKKAIEAGMNEYNHSLI